MNKARYDFRVIALAQALEKHYPNFHNNILQEVARALGIERSPIEPNIGLNRIEWRTREGQPATAEDEWARVFAYTREGKPLPEEVKHD